MMKRIALLALVVMLVPVFAFGLEITVGARAGLGHFGAWGDDYAETVDDLDASRALSLGYTVGAYGSFALIDMFAVQPELWYTSGGYSLESDGGDLSFTARTLEAPVLGKLRFGIGPAKVIGFLGPNFRFKVGNFETDLDGNTVEQEDVKSAVVGSVVGAGAEFNLIAVVLSADLRYYLDFMPWDDSDAESDTKDQSARLTVGVGIPLL
jgi:hypothetical protein